MSSQETQYQNPRAIGSLSGALAAWQRLRGRRAEATPRRVVFTFSCWSESRARRVAGFLRRRTACAATRVHHVAGASRDTWQVSGSTHPAIHTLASLEAAWSWLRRAGHSHQAVLLRVAVRAPAA